MILLYALQQSGLSIQEHKQEFLRFLDFWHLLIYLIDKTFFKVLFLQQTSFRTIKDMS